MAQPSDFFANRQVGNRLTPRVGIRFRPEPDVLVSDIQTSSDLSSFLPGVVDVIDRIVFGIDIQIGRTAVETNWIGGHPSAGLGIVFPGTEMQQTGIGLPRWSVIR